MPLATPVVFVVDDDVSVRESLEMLIPCEGWLCETFASAAEFLERPRVRVASCLLLDVRLPGLTGLDLQKLISTERSDLPIIFITGHADVATAVQAMRAGAIEFLTKPLDATVLIDAIRAALVRSETALRRIERGEALRSGLASLTPREKEVMDLLVSGLLNKQVGGELGISEITVKAHRGKVMRKMNAHSFAHLVQMAAELSEGSEPSSFRLISQLWARSSRFEPYVTS